MMPAQVPEVKSFTPVRSGWAYRPPPARALRRNAERPRIARAHLLHQGPMMSNITLIWPPTRSCSAPAVPL
jgi:hypothetical protein